MNNINKKMLFVIFKNDGTLRGFYTNLEVIESIIYPNNVKSLENNLRYCCITMEMHQYALSFPNIKINIEYIDKQDTDDIPIIDSKDGFILSEKEIDLNNIISELISSIKGCCRNMIIMNQSVTLSDGNTKEFSYKIEDQINLETIKNNYKPGDMIFYHATGEYDTLYSYEDILIVYKTLYNNKLYNQIYTQILCQWITNNYTNELHESKDDIIIYGYSNQEIEERVRVLYDEQKLL